MKCIKCGITVKSGKGNLNYVTFGGKENTMKNHYFHLAYTVKKNGKFYAAYRRVSPSCNLVSLTRSRNMFWANLYPTKKEAIATVDEWNQSFIDNGTHIFHNYLGA